jgi:hypothetical protein
METSLRRLVIGLVAMLASVPAFAQSRVYTNADLGRPLERTATVTPEQLASLAAHQFRLPSPYPSGPQVVIIGNPDDGPFGPFKDLPPTAPLSNGPYLFGTPLFYGGPFLLPGWNQASASFPQQPMRRAAGRRGR